mmetsp:Transcript_31637/g.74458  ORF Transcript_31637/g.74458 Transcript_31637/m.74458 type:complete len:110 (-) Transcript_31637:1561-1890(-)
MRQIGQDRSSPIVPPKEYVSVEVSSPRIVDLKPCQTSPASEENYVVDVCVESLPVFFTEIVFFTDPCAFWISLSITIMLHHTKWIHGEKICKAAKATFAENDAPRIPHE